MISFFEEITFIRKPSIWGLFTMHFVSFFWERVVVQSVEMQELDCCVP